MSEDQAFARAALQAGYHLVYDRKDEPCVNCGAPIRAVVVGQRSSFYCPSCQR